MEILWIALILTGAAAELIYWDAYMHNQKKKKRMAEKSLHKLLEERVLVNTLKERINSEQASQAEMRKIFLYVEFPDTRPLVMHLFSLDDCVTIGRSSENLICIRDQMISRMHCKIYEANGYPAIQDMGTANGVMIRRGLFRKIKLKRGQQIYLRSGDRLQMGDYKMKIQILHGWEARA